MVDPITIEVRGNPVGKGSVRVTRTGAFIPSKSRAWMDLVRLIAKSEVHPEPLTCPVHIDLDWRRLIEAGHCRLSGGLAEVWPYAWETV